ncbi:peptidoglycan editing factor PgeF [Lipingzhangella sp. LS1_29]|uniref:Purine nucleoside phosphorylase n=1 Tax=Lipingzhangella rawalii TaxID=2055835 RepID=A0ABU2H3G9_9ACTN|nr:peptidoglycan editing factor PgeF [Lipingzhangella rawalii]MDS1269394.1 peptidoglycan editing factor PgeF [Lipingzhangella rawalii]
MTATSTLGAGVHTWTSQRWDGGVSAPPFARLNLSHGVGDERAAVTRNREIAAEHIGISANQVAWMDQVHGADVAVVSEPGGVSGVDALVTTRSEVVLAVQVADCLPLVLADAEAGVVGAAHSGRPGTVAGVAFRLVSEMSRQGAVPGRMTALLGPAICGRCYEVGRQLQERVGQAVPEAVCHTRAGTPGVDLRSGVSAQLRRAGVRDLRHDPRCTLENSELFSYRRDGRTGRFATFVWRSQRE